MITSLNLQDVFHIGQVKRDVGNAFGCSKNELWEEKYRLSPSGLTTNNYSATYPLLLNRDGTKVCVEKQI